jgi:hypothetical protein
MVSGKSVISSVRSAVNRAINKVTNRNITGGDSSKIASGSASTTTSYAPKTVSVVSSKPTATGGSTSRGGGGGGGGSNNVPQIGSASVTTTEAQAIGKATIPTSVITANKNIQGAVAVTQGTGSKIYTAGSNIGGTGDRFGDSGISGTPMQLTIADKLKYQYEKADINMGGYLPSGATPAQINARNNAQLNADKYLNTYNQYQNADTETLVKALAPSYQSFLGQDKTNKKALQDILTKKIEDRFLETKKNELQGSIDNQIKDAQDKLNSNFNNLQARVNEGSLSVTDAEDAYKKLTEQAQKDLEKNVGDLEQRWYNERGKFIVASDTKLLSDVNFATSLDKSLSAKSLAKTAVISSAIVASGGLASAGLFGSAVASATPTVMTGLGILGGSALAYQGVTTTQNLIELKKQGLLTKTAIIASIAPTLTHVIVGVGSGLATGVAISPARNNLINKEASKFNKEILKSEKLQQEYWTPENIKQGYFIKKVNGVEVKFNVPTQRQLNALEIARANKGLQRIEKIESAGTLTDRNQILGYLQKDAKARVLFQKEGIATDLAEVGKFYRKNNYGKLEQWNYIRQASMVDKNGNSIAVAFKVTSTGKVVGTRVTRIDVIDGKAVGGFFRPAYPSERQVVKVPVKNNPPLEVYKKGELKLLAKVKQVSQEKVIGVKQDGERVTTLIEQKSSLFKIGTGGKETRSFAELKNLANKETSLFPVRNIKQIGRGTTQIRTTTEGGKGLFVTQGVLETNLPKPTKSLNFKIDKVFSKSMKVLPENKPLLNIKTTTNPPQKNPFTNMPKEPIKPDTPSMIQMGNQGSGSSIYGDGYNEFFGVLQPKVAYGNKLYSVDLAPTSTLDYANANYLIGLNLPKIKAPVITSKITSANQLFITPKESLLFRSKINVLEPQAGLKTDVFKGRDMVLVKNDIQMSQLFTTTKPQTLIRSRSGTLIKPIQDQISIVTPIVTPKPILKPILPPKPFRAQEPFIPKPYVEPFFGLPNLGDIQTGGGERVRETRAGLFGKTEYTASLGSVLLRAPKKKVTAEEYAQLSKKKYLGLGLRPQIEIVSKKKKNALGLF